jgi:phosphatidylserine/phosphatidylglycerophosphate/cardiolipin synthase-like enzyme
VIDQRVAIVGTQNLDPRSEFWNTESLVVVKSEKAAGDLRSAILGQAEGSEVLSAGHAALSGRGRTGFSTRMKRALLPFLKLVSPFMRSCL